jgi:hypothetical protein
VPYWRESLSSAKLVVEDALALKQQPADEGALAVVNAAAGDEAQGLLVALAFEKGRDVLCVQGVHQK